MPSLRIVAGVTAVCAATLAAQPDYRAYPSPLVREEVRIVVNGAEELWTLRWRKRPKPYCPTSYDSSLTCPCTGFAYGEAGDLDLIRTSRGREIDRLHLTPLFRTNLDGPNHLAALQRWPVEYREDFQLLNGPPAEYSEAVRERPTTRVMNFFDYDHDGSATEFYLQIEVKPCGKSIGIVVGVSNANIRLHAFGTVSDPPQPLQLQRRAWDALRETADRVELTDWDCGDHGSNVEVVLKLRSTPEGVDGRRLTYACGPTGRASLVGDGPL